MVKAIILFRQGSRPAIYDQRYNDFLMKLEALPGLRRKSVCNVYSGPGGSTPYRAIVEVFFDDRPSLEAALTSPPGVEAGRLLRDFAATDAVILYADAMEESFAAPPPADS